MNKKKNFRSLYKKIGVTNRYSVYNAFVSCKILYIVEKKTEYWKLKSFSITIYKYYFYILNAIKREFHGTNTNSYSINMIYIQKDTGGDLQYTSLIRTKNEINVGVNEIKNKDSFFFLICDPNSLKLAFYQIKSNLKILFFTTSKTTLSYINEKWFSKTNKLLLEQCHVK